MSVIITATDLNTYLGKTLNPGTAAMIVAAVNKYVETQTHRVWGDTKTVIERYGWSKTIWLRHMDVTEITSISLGWPGRPATTIDSSAFFFDSWGRITLFWQLQSGSRHSSYFRDYVAVNYTYGVAEVPEDLKEAAIGVAISYYNWAIAGGKEIVSTSVGSFRQEFIGAVRGGTGSPTPFKDTSEAHFMTIKGYAMQRV